MNALQRVRIIEYTKLLQLKENDHRMLAYLKEHRKLSHKKRTPKSRRRESAEKPYGVAPSAGLKCSVRDNFYSFARFDPEPGTEKNTIPAARRRKCAFCGKQRTLYKC